MCCDFHEKRVTCHSGHHGNWDGGWDGPMFVAGGFAPGFGRGFVRGFTRGLGRSFRNGGGCGCNEFGGGFGNFRHDFCDFPRC